MKQVACEFAVANMGQDIKQLAYVNSLPENYASSAWNRLVDESASEEIDISAEYRAWLKDAKKLAAALKKKGLPLTLGNALLAFRKKGPFAV